MSSPFSSTCKNCSKSIWYHSIVEAKRCSEKWKSNKGNLDYYLER